MAGRVYEHSPLPTPEGFTSGFVTQQDINYELNHTYPFIDDYSFNGLPTYGEEEFAQMMASDFSWPLPDAASLDAGDNLVSDPLFCTDVQPNDTAAPNGDSTQDAVDMQVLDPRLFSDSPPHLTAASKTELPQGGYSDAIAEWYRPALRSPNGVPEAQDGFQQPSPKTAGEILRLYMAGELVPNVSAKNGLGSRPVPPIHNQSVHQQPVNRRNFNPNNRANHPTLPESAVHCEDINPSSRGGKRGFNNAFPEEPASIERSSSSYNSKRPRRQLPSKPPPRRGSSRPSKAARRRYDTPVDELESLESPPQDKEQREKNNRPANIRNLDPSKWYEPLDAPPPSWGSLDTSTGRHIFQYNSQGELKPGKKFSVDEIREYLEDNPRHWVYNPPCYKKSGLTLWVQICPADSVNRYPTTFSSKCRFANCPVPNNTMRKGEYRVAFDEQSYKDLDPPLDPFHNSGYAHLYCFEKNFDFPYICKTYNVRPDNRQFAEGTNRMAITRDYPQMRDIVNRFMKKSTLWNGRRPQDWYSESLCFALTKEYLKSEPPRRQQVRNERAGNSIDVHMNNLDVMVTNLEKRKREKMRERLAAKHKRSFRSSKRRRRTYEEDEEDDDYDDDDDDDDNNDNDDDDDDDEYYNENVYRRRVKKPRVSRQ